MLIIITEKTYQSLSLQEVIQKQEDAIQQLKPLLGDSVNPRILLNHYRVSVIIIIIITNNKL